MRSKLYPKLAWSGIRKNRKFYLPYIIACVTAIAMFYNILALTLNPDVPELSGGESIQSILQFGVYVVGIFTVILLFYTNSFLQKQRKKELGLYEVLGMEKKHVAAVMAWESLFLYAITLAGGLGIGMLLNKLLFLMFTAILHGYVTIHAVIQPQALFITAASYAGIFAALYMVNVLRIGRSDPVELLHAGSEGDREPKTNIFLALIGGVCLVTGYTLSVAINNPVETIQWFFIAIVLVIIGTYCLFSAGSIFILKRLRANKSYYYQTKHFINISSMLYRMKQNAAGLASICILSTMVLVAVSTTVSTYFSLDEIMVSAFPNDFAITVHDATDTRAAEAEDIILRDMTAAGTTEKNAIHYSFGQMFGAARGDDITFDYAYVESLGVNQSGEYRFVTAIPLADYNRLTGQNVTLAPNELLFYQPKAKTDAPQSLSIAGTRYTVAGSAGDFPDIEEAQGNYYTTYYLVLDDPSTILAWTNASNQTAYTTLARNLQFDYDTTADTKALSTTLTNDLNTLSDVRVDTRDMAEDNFYPLYGSLLFLGLFLGLMFFGATALIIYYKQVTEGYDDKDRYTIMKNVGLSDKEIKGTINNQILMVFFLPVLLAVVHLVFAFPAIRRILILMNFNNTPLFMLAAAGTACVFAAVYCLVYVLTSGAYRKIVE